MATDLLAQIPKWEQEAEEHERKAQALRQIIEGVRALNGEAARLFNIDGQRGSARTKRTNQYLPDEGPRGREAVRLIVRERPGLWKTSAIKDEVQRRGWPSSPLAIDTAIKRMETAGEAKRERKGLYRFMVNGEGVA